jgi:Zn-dependent M28 family amino/carboxypeptidase
VAGVLLRVAFGLVLGLALLVSLAGILLTGPVLVQRQPILTGITASAARLRASVEMLCGELSPRSHARPDRLEATAAWIADEMREAGLAVEAQDYTVEGRGFRNVIGLRRGTAPASEIVVIGAHYDAYAGYPGADDNASGVAVLLELARTLPPGPRARTVMFAAFSTEEPPYFGSESMGSFVLASRLVDEGIDVGLMIALDMVGYYSDRRGSQLFPFKGLGLFYPSVGNFVAVVGDLRSGRAIARVKGGLLSVGTIPVHSFRASPAWAPVHFSDHWSFRRLGIPAVQVTDTAFMRFPHYHTPQDVPERLDYARMARLVEALHGVLLE